MPMKAKRVRIVVEINLDPVPGFNHDEQDYADHLRYDLEHSIPWYKPSVSAAELLPEQVEA